MRQSHTRKKGGDTVIFHKNKQTNKQTKSVLPQQPPFQAHNYKKLQFQNKAWKHLSQFPHFCFQKLTILSASTQYKKQLKYNPGFKKEMFKKKSLT